MFLWFFVGFYWLWSICDGVDDEFLIGIVEAILFYIFIFPLDNYLSFDCDEYILFVSEEVFDICCVLSELMFTFKMVIAFCEISCGSMSFLTKIMYFPF